MPVIFVSQFRIRHRIESALGKRSAAPQSLQRQPASALRSVQRNRFLRVLRTRRIKFAGPAEKWRKKNAIELHQRQQQPLSRRAPESARTPFVAAVVRQPLSPPVKFFPKYFPKKHLY